MRELGEHLHVPTPPSGPALTTAVLSRLDDRPRRTRPALAVRLVAAAVALLAALGVAMAVSPQVRAAVFDLLRVGGVELNQGPPPPLRTTAPDAALPGERPVALDQARAAAAFPVAVPRSLGDPDSVLLAGGDPPRVVSLRYTGAGETRIDQFDGVLGPVFQKFAGAPDAVPSVVDGHRGIWVPRPHLVLYLDRDGRLVEEAARLAGTTLIWEADGVTYRIEGPLSHEQALEIAESLR
ncbi:hypothetical protein BU204_24610 [Actinophytocola xanthii]|uniref:DUF4367 domain-containing protein n=1 Tax=Actinophytocola xanthii TaxID=1912961 RepID=A0A1Q8CKR8_9PSEU|nr:hypothetical protein BU204_24610 [Actinophytocola xanthii]